MKIKLLKICSTIVSIVVPIGTISSCIENQNIQKNNHKPTYKMWTLIEFAAQGR